MAKDLAFYVTIYLQNYRPTNLKYHATATVDQSQLTSHVPGPLPWKLPLAGALKLNIDAAVDVKKNVIGIGAIVRDLNRCVTAALSMSRIGNFSSHEMEAKAIFHSLNWALQQQLLISLVETEQ
uniref:RNase H type-1 domain-containing protein n=1 Tax=Cannabis sativa TaxID=3483 RepID=A0A803QP10_CANSA